MSLYSVNPEIKKEIDAQMRGIVEDTKKEVEEYRAKLVYEWVDKELKKMGYLKKEE